MIKFDNTIQSDILSLALKYAGYNAVAMAALAVIDSNEATPDSVKGAIRAMAFRMASFNGGTPQAASILKEIQTCTWEAIGLPVDGVPALDTAQREAIINVIMGVSKQVILAEANRLELLAANDTVLPQGWND